MSMSKAAVALAAKMNREAQKEKDRKASTAKADASKKKGDKKAAKKAQKPTPVAKKPQKQQEAPQKPNKVNKPQDVYREGGSYNLVVAALASLGMGKMHTSERLIAAYVDLAPANVLKHFKSKESRNEETGKSWKDRIIQNATVVCRPDYGAPLELAGFKVRKERNEAKELTFGLYKIK